MIQTEDLIKDTRKTSKVLKADQPHSCYYLYMPPIKDIQIKQTP